MTEENIEQDQRAMTPEMQSFKVTATRVFEVDFPEQQVKALMQETGEEEPDEAVATAFLQQEQGLVEPTQKLIGADVQVDGPSDD